MTQQDHDAEVGRLVRERRELRERFEALLARGRNVGALLNGIGHALTVHAAGSRYPGTHLAIEKGVVNVADQYQNNKILSGPYPTADDVSQLIDDVRVTQDKIAQLDASLKAFGV